MPSPAALAKNASKNAPVLTVPFAVAMGCVMTVWKAAALVNVMVTGTVPIAANVRPVILALTAQMNVLAVPKIPVTARELVTAV